MKTVSKMHRNEFAKFKEFMEKLVSVPLGEVKELESAKKPKPKRHSASRAANGKS